MSLYESDIGRHTEHHCLVCGERFEHGIARGDTGVGYEGYYCPEHDAVDGS